MIRVLILLLSVMSVGAFAAERRYSENFTSCSRQSGGVTVAIRDCIDAEHTRLDGELNRRYRALMRGLPSAKAQALRQSERRWLIDRKRTCDAAGNSEAGGTLQMIMIDSCYLDSLYDRVSTLRAMQR